MLSPARCFGILDDLRGYERGWPESSPPGRGSCGVWRAQLLARPFESPALNLGFGKLLKWHRFIKSDLVDCRYLPKISLISDRYVLLLLDSFELVLY